MSNHCGRTRDYCTKSRDYTEHEGCDRDRSADLAHIAVLGCQNESAKYEKQEQIHYRLNRAQCRTHAISRLVLKVPIPHFDICTQPRHFFLECVSSELAPVSPLPTNQFEKFVDPVLHVHPDET